jgi:acyl-CoA thioesterase-1
MSKMAPARIRRAFSVALLVLAGACSSQTGLCGLPKPASPLPTATQDAAATPAGTRAQPSGAGIAILGDSITAGLGLMTDQAFPARLQEMFAAEGYNEVDVINGGLSGDTTAGGVRRVEQLLEPNVRILVVALGGNDALRGLSANETHDNLAKIIDMATAKRVGVVLVGMEAPTNLGIEYRTAFHDAYVQLSQQYRGTIAFVPFLLEGVAGNPALNQTDGIHPNEAGARAIATLLYPELRRRVDELPSPGGHE